MHIYNKIYGYFRFQLFTYHLSSFKLAHNAALNNLTDLVGDTEILPKVAKLLIFLHKTGSIDM